jgi:hypothetical protein
MINYKQIIQGIVGRPVVDKENQHPNLPSPAEEQLRRVNFRLQ